MGSSITLDIFGRHVPSMPGSHGGVLQTTGLCAYCDVPTLASCGLCGRAICERHAVADESICLDCGGRSLD